VTKSGGSSLNGQLGAPAGREATREEGQGGLFVNGWGDEAMVLGIDIMGKS